MLQVDRRKHQVTMLRIFIDEAAKTPAGSERQAQIIRDAIDKCAELQAGLMTDLDNARTHK